MATNNQGNNQGSATRGGTHQQHVEGGKKGGETHAKHSSKEEDGKKTATPDNREASDAGNGRGGNHNPEGHNQSTKGSK